MDYDIKKLTLSETQINEVGVAQAKVEEEFLAPDKVLPYVIGMGIGVKWKNEQPTGEPALIVFVTQKLPKSELKGKDVVKDKLADMQTDVQMIGTPTAGGGQVLTVSTQTLAQRIRPAEGGYSIGHYKITAGTLSTCVYDILPGGSVYPTRQGIGIPPKYYILSNNHVLANSNNARIGDPILQPGPYDGGREPEDRIARLSRFVPIYFNSPIQPPRCINLVDAAVAEGQFHDLDREIYWIGYVRGWRPKKKVTVGAIVQKTGRTTNYTIGRITAVNATVNVNYGAAGVACFKDQIVTTNMSAGGDSGSLVTTLDNVAVGLLFAGSPYATIVNQIENVRALLKIEVAEEIL